MLSDEEKKAIERFKNFIYTYQDVIEDEYSDYEEKESAKEYQEVSEKILNLIEKQSKKIEELTLDLEEMTKSNNHKKENWVHKSILNSYISKDKIKAKIEEIQQRRENDGECELALHGFQREAKIEVLQSLLEKE